LVVVAVVVTAEETVIQTLAETVVMFHLEDILPMVAVEAVELMLAEIVLRAVEVAVVA
jgi:hypothetical protein